VIVAIGDSITFGQKLDDISKSWPDLLKAAGYEVESRGVPGDTTRLGLERFPRDVQDDCPAQVIIQFGHNDANRWETDRARRSRGAIPYLCTLTPSFRPEPHPTDCARYDQIIRRVADEEGVTIIDVRAAFSAELDVRSLLMEDGLHLSEAGHQVYADAVQRVLDAEPKP
jgi:lysophospholipase L1-like esterase